MIAAIFTASALGVWQFTTAHRNDIAQKVLAAPTVPLNQVSLFGAYVREATYGQSVSFTGVLDCTNAVSVTGVSSTAPWYVCRVGLADGTSVALVLGKLPASGQPQMLQNSDVTVVGRIQPAQESAQLSAIYVPQKGTVEFLNSDDLVIRWQTDLRDGYVVLTSLRTQTGAVATTGLQTLASSALIVPPTGIELRNLFYAWQWWFFALFVGFLWAKFVWDEIKLAGTPRPSSSAK